MVRAYALPFAGFNVWDFNFPSPKGTNSNDDEQQARSINALTPLWPQPLSTIAIFHRQAVH